MEDVVHTKNNKIYSIFFLLFATLLQTNSQAWHPFTPHNTEYMVSTWLAVNYVEAKSMCKAQNARLVVLKEPEVRLFIIDLLQFLGFRNSSAKFYIGLKRPPEDPNSFEWEDGSTLEDADLIWISKQSGDFVVLTTPINGALQLKTVSNGFDCYLNNSCNGKFICERPTSRWRVDNPGGRQANGDGENSTEDNFVIVDESSQGLIEGLGMGSSNFLGIISLLLIAAGGVAFLLFYIAEYFIYRHPAIPFALA